MGAAKVWTNEPHLFGFRRVEATSFPFGSLSVSRTVTSVFVRKSRVCGFAW